MSKLNMVKAKLIIGNIKVACMVDAETFIESERVKCNTGDFHVEVRKAKPGGDLIKVKASCCEKCDKARMRVLKLTSKTAGDVKNTLILKKSKSGIFLEMDKETK